jgi:hypothetical protein
VVLFVDTSVWSLAFRRDRPEAVPEVRRLVAALAEGEDIALTGVIVQELFQGLHGPKRRRALMERMRAVPLVAPSRDDHLAAAELHGRCRRRGVQVGTVDALLAALCIRRDLVMLSVDGDFRHVARHEPLRLWAPSAA